MLEQCMGIGVCPSNDAMYYMAGNVSDEGYLDILLLQQGTPGSNATLSPTCLLVTPGPTSMMSLHKHAATHQLSTTSQCSSISRGHCVPVLEQPCKGSAMPTSKHVSSPSLLCLYNSVLCSNIGGGICAEASLCSCAPHY